jgi:hypothetical protein
MTGTGVRTALPDPATDPAGYVLAVADLREQRASAATQGEWVAAVQRGKTPVVGVRGDRPGTGQAIAVSGAPGREGAGRANAKHIAAEANPEHALAEVALWRGVVKRHTGTADELRPRRVCACCTFTAPCPDLLAVVAAARAYAGSER